MPIRFLVLAFLIISIVSDSSLSPDPDLLPIATREKIRAETVLSSYFYRMGPFLSLPSIGESRPAVLQRVSRALYHGRETPLRPPFGAAAGKSVFANGLHRGWLLCGIKAQDQGEQRPPAHLHRLRLVTGSGGVSVLNNKVYLKEYDFEPHLFRLSV
jgi:hypothetical protein